MATHFGAARLRFPISLFQDVRDTIPQPVTPDYRELQALLAPPRPEIRPDIARETQKRLRFIDRCVAAVAGHEVVEDWLARNGKFRALERAAYTGGADALAEKAEKMREAARKEAKGTLPCWSPASFAACTTRLSGNALALSCVVFDYDDGTTPAFAVAPWSQYPFFLSSTWSHSDLAPRFRLVLPLEEPVPAAYWKQAWAWAVERSAGQIDRSCSDPARMYLLPAVPSSDHPYLYEHRDPGGRLLRIDWEKLPAPSRVTTRTSRATHRSVPVGVRIQPSLSRRRVQQLLKTSGAARERAAERLGATVTGGRAEHIDCPSCEQDSVWFYLAPGPQTVALCNHKNSCGWVGFLDQLLDLNGG